MDRQPTCSRSERTLRLRPIGPIVDIVAIGAAAMMLSLAWDAARGSPVGLPAMPVAATIAPAPVAAGAGAAHEVDLVEVRAAARAVLLARCLPCHSRSAAGANPRALAIYDLDEADWWQRLTPARLPKLLGRFSSGPVDQRQTMTAFVEAELRVRSP